MGKQVCCMAQMKCEMGAAPAMLGVLPTNRVMTSNQPAANIMDNKPFVNIPAFGMCKSPANPAVAAATAAAMGVLTPQPCTPMTAAAPWVPGSPTVLIANMPALNDSSKLVCMFGPGPVISITNPGQTSHDIP